MLREFKVSITVLIMAIAIIFIIHSFSQTSNYNYNYEIIQDTDYKVYIEENDFIQKDYLGKDEVYIQNLVRYIGITFLYDYKTTQKSDLNYNYDILAVLEIDYSNTNQVLIEKEYPIISNKALQAQDTNKIEIKENVNIDYQKYYQEVQKFKEQFNLPVKAYLKVNFNIKTTNTFENKSKISASELTIDLSQPVFEIKVQQSEEQKESIVEVEKPKINYNVFIIGSILLIGSIMYLIYQIRKYRMITHTKFELKIKEILRKYGDIVVELEEEPKIIFENIIDVKKFSELIDIEEEIREPILYYKKENNAVFVIISNNIIYRKIVEKEDKDKI